eukprot:NODE_721_length_4486_cov_1.005015.p4 type:complete len:142 gc:universal NODE_721_length_4486_cov_1.005015:2829-3254(+)
MASFDVALSVSLILDNKMSILSGSESLSENGSERTSLATELTTFVPFLTLEVGLEESDISTEDAILSLFPSKLRPIGSVCTSIEFVSTRILSSLNRFGSGLDKSSDLILTTLLPLVSTKSVIVSISEVKVSVKVSLSIGSE